MRFARQRDRGSGTILMIGVLAVIVSVMAGGLAVVSAVHASLQARTAADLSALAAQSVQLRGDGPTCAAAVRVASANGADVTSCVPTGVTVTISVTVSTGATRRLGLGPARARSKAGPPRIEGSVAHKSGGISKEPVQQ